MATPNLNITEVVANQNQKEVTINDAFTALDVAVTEFIAVDVSSNYTLSAAEFRENVFFRATTVGVGAALVTPMIKRLFVVENQDTNALIVRRGSTDLTLDGGEAGLYYTDGTANGLVAIASGGGGGSSGTAVFSYGDASRTAVAQDGNAYVILTASNAAYTVPPDSSLDFPVGTTIAVEQAGAGNVEIIEGMGVTVRHGVSYDPFIAGQFLNVQLIKVAANTWSLYGSLMETP